MESITAQHAVKVLNEALKADPTAMNKLFFTRVACTEELSQHPTIQVRGYETGNEPQPPNVGVLGLINGIFGVNDRNYGFVCMVLEDGKIDRFEIMG